MASLKSVFMLLAILAFASVCTEAKQVIVKYADNNKEEVISSIEDAGGRIVKELLSVNAFAVAFEDEKPNMLGSAPGVLLIEEDMPRYPIDVEENEGAALGQEVPFGIPLVEADKVDEKNVDQILVCIIDSGYDRGHEDLPSNVDGTNDRGTGNWFEDPNTHGTHVAGTIAALDNQIGVVGVVGSGNMEIHIIKVFDAQRWAYSSDLIDAVHRCEEAAASKNKKLVINMSLGGSRSSVVEREAFAASYARGTFSIAAAGNSYYGHSYPASYPSVMSVAAVDKNKKLAYFSQRNDQVEIAAPGVDVRSTLPGNQYGAYSGTSMACPHTVGVAALVWSHHTSCPASSLRKAMTATAEDLGSPGRDNEYGHGLVSALRAKEYLDKNPC